MDVKDLSVLVVDDDMYLAKFVQVLVEDIGAKAFIAQSKAEIPNILAEHNINGAFVDVILRRDSGIHIGECLTNKAGIPVVFCTGVDDPTNVPLLYEIGWYIKKPVTREAVKRGLLWFAQCGRVATTQLCPKE